MTTLEEWLEPTLRHAAQELLASVSPVSLVKRREGFGQTVRARRGAVVASPVLAAYDPDPDYFFHWFRDSAVVVDALRELHRAGGLGDEAFGHLKDFCDFSLELLQLDGRHLVAASQWRQRVIPEYQQYLRPESELAAVRGQAVSGETRVNPDGSLDISRWARPQYDGPALRALTLLRWLRLPQLPPESAQSAGELLRADLEFVARHGDEPSFDIWEEELGLHYYTLRVSAAALKRGAVWLQTQQDAALARTCAVRSHVIGLQLEQFWSMAESAFRSRILPSGAPSAKELDIAVILAAVHADDGGAEHSPRDSRLQQTLARLEQYFGAAYAINQGRSLGPAMGRYPGDHYYSGGAYYFSTLGAAEFCYRAVEGPHSRAWYERAEAYLDTVRRYTPASGDLAEQFDQNTGVQTSAKRLSWSYAALISCAAARRAALTQLA